MLSISTDIATKVQIMDWVPKENHILPSWCNNFFLQYKNLILIEILTVTLVQNEGIWKIFQISHVIYWNYPLIVLFFFPSIYATFINLKNIIVKSKLLVWALIESINEKALINLSFENVISSILVWILTLNALRNLSCLIV